MIDTVLIRKNATLRTQITAKGLVSLTIIAAAVLLPQLVHLALGAPGGAQWLPMYLPVLVGGCLLGSRWGAAAGVCAPLVSFILTSALGNPMPASGRLPYMIVELAVFALICGLFSEKIMENKWMAFPAVLTAQISGRLSFFVMAAVLQRAGGIPADTVLAQIQTGLTGLYLQAVIAPVIIIALRAFLLKKEEF